MQLKCIDRCLLLVALVCALLTVTSGSSKSQNPVPVGVCDQQCREVKRYYWDSKSAIKCYFLKQYDCSPCASNNPPGGCRFLELPGEGVCEKTDTSQEEASATGCELWCVLVPGGIAQTANTKGLRDGDWYTIDHWGCMKR